MPSGIMHDEHDDTKRRWVSGSKEPPAQLVPPLLVPNVSSASGPPILLSTGGMKTGPMAYDLISCNASARNFGVKSMRSSTEIPLRSYTGGLVGKGCVGEYHSPGTSPFGTGFSSIGHTGWPVTRSKTNSIDCLVGTATALMVLPFTTMSPRIGGAEMSMSHRP